MKCPVCKTVDLKMSDRQGIEIDYCPQCRGVWLDRGELDKIIERSARLEREFEAPKARPLGELVQDDVPFYDDDTDYPVEKAKRKNDDSHARSADARRGNHDRDRHDEKRDKKRRRKSFIEDIFDEIFD